MSELETIRQQETRNVLVPSNADKHAKYRLGMYATWLAETDSSWFTPDLASYRDRMLADGKAPATVSAHLSTIRARYKTLTRDRPQFFAMVPDSAVDGQNFGSRKEAVDELIQRINDSVHPAESKVTVLVKQDVADSEHLRLTPEQAETLMSAPDRKTLKGLRDCAVLALLLCTGIREQELSNLDVDDLRQELSGELALRVKQGKGCKQRLIPYGSLSGVLVVVDRWLESAGISDGPVFRGMFKGGKKLRPGRLSVRAIEYILASYPVVIDGKKRNVKPHDARRSYARNLYLSGMVLLSIQQNLGHADSRTTEHYIGSLSADERRPSGIYNLAVLVNGK